MILHLTGGRVSLFFGKQRKRLENPGSPGKGNVLGPLRRQEIQVFRAVLKTSLESGILHSLLLEVAQGEQMQSTSSPSLAGPHGIISTFSFALRNAETS